MDVIKKRVKKRVFRSPTLGLNQAVEKQNEVALAFYDITKFYQPRKGQSKDR